MESRILVVDDEPLIQEVYETALSDAGYSVVTAGSGEEALRILKKGKINVMFLDLRMPGMDGLELCRKIRKSNPIACIYAVTGYASIFELADCREAGFDDYFNKPIDLKLLVKTAQDAFAKIDRWKKR